MNTKFTYQDVIKKETQNEVRLLVLECMKRTSKHIAVVSRETGIAASTLGRWITTNKPTGYINMSKIIMWLLENSKDKNIKIISLHLETPQ
jgi:hypothetical protein